MDYEKLSLKPNDVLVFRIADIDKEKVDAYLEQTKELRENNPGVTFLFLSSTDATQYVPEADMNRMGWFREKPLQREGKKWGMQDGRLRIIPG